VPPTEAQVSSRAYARRRSNENGNDNGACNEKDCREKAVMSGALDEETSQSGLNNEAAEQSGSGIWWNQEVTIEVESQGKDGRNGPQS
jgi:hypothetical protein